MQPLAAVDYGTEAGKVLAERCILVDLSIKVPPLHKVDKQASRETLRRYDADTDAGRLSKQLFPKDALKGVIAAEGEARTYHYERTLPWCDSGKRILPSRLHLEYMEAMQRFRSSFEREREAFLRDAPVHIEAARRRLGRLFELHDYRTVGWLRTRFGFDIEVAPIPTSDDFRVIGTPETVRVAWEAQYAERLEAALEETRRDLGRRIYEVAQRMATTLAQPDKRFHNTMVTNIRELADMLPGLNFTDDEAVGKLGNRLRSTLGSYDPQQLRDDKAVRAEAAVKAAEIVRDIDKGALGFFLGAGE